MTLGDKINNMMCQGFLKQLLKGMPELSKEDKKNVKLCIKAIGNFSKQIADKYKDKHGIKK